MSDAKKSEKKSVKKKHSSSSSTKNKKNEDPHHVPSLPCDQRSQKLTPSNSLHPHRSYHSEQKVCSPSKKPKPDCSTHGSLPAHQKTVSPVSSRDCSPPEVICKRTSSGSHYYKLSHSTKKHIESPDSGRSGSVPVVKRKADVQPGDEAGSLKKKAICQKDETQTYKDEKGKKKKKKKTKLTKKEVFSKKQESAADELSKIQKKLGTFVNTFKIVTLPKESSSDIFARTRAFEEYCDKRARLIKSRKAKSSFIQKDPELKPLPSTTLNESLPCRENKECLPESNTPSSAQKLENTSSSICVCDVEDLEEEMQIVEELVTARSEKKLDLAVAQTCGELTSMDIDSSEDDAHNLPVNASCTSLLIVIDTNIMIGHLQFIKTLKTMEIPGLGKPVLIIPWVVLQELDYMKNGKLLQTVKHKAIPAVDFIYICLKNQDPQLWGQSMQQASQKLYGLSAENNDDRVLHCCIQYQKLYPNARLLLCTDDKNLCNKAIVSDVKAVSKADLFAAMQNLLMTTVDQSSCISMPSFYEGQISKTQTSDEISNPNASSPFRNVISDLEKFLGLALSKILETEMKMVFEDLWVEILFLKPPWTLSDLLQCFKKHWLAVFGMIVKRDLLQSVDFLYKHLCKGATIDHVLMKSVLKQTSMLLNAFISRSNYDGVLPQACEQIGKLLETVSKVTDICLQSSSNPKEDVLESSVPAVIHECEVKQPELQNPQNINRHQEIWMVLETLCNTVAQYSNEVFQKFTDIQERMLTQPNTNVLPIQEAFICLQKLMMAVNSILEGIQRILVPNSSPEEVWPLYNVLVNNEIHVTGFKFSAMELYECLSQNEYRQKLTIGCQQLAALEYTMKTLNESICFEAKSRGWM